MSNNELKKHDHKDNNKSETEASNDREHEESEVTEGSIADGTEAANAEQREASSGRSTERNRSNFVEVADENSTRGEPNESKFSKIVKYYVTPIAAFGLLIATIFLFLATNELSKSTKEYIGVSHEILVETKLHRTYEMAPRLMLQSSVVRYRSLNEVLVLTLLNVGKGYAYSISVGLEHEGEDTDGWTKPFRWYKSFRNHKSLLYLKEGSQQEVLVHLKNDYASHPLPTESEKWEQILSGGGTNYKVYLAYMDFEGMQYLESYRLLDRPPIAAGVEEFFSRIHNRGLGHKTGDYFPRHHDSVMIYQVKK
ncbi:MAG: hypothetical protein KAW02_00350 [candidate division Zixibacteria bacterium]|nr:hypothetical protein [candidate division Zixibacteria bacterium]